jgi:hypothetical protein
MANKIISSPSAPFSSLICFALKLLPKSIRTSAESEYPTSQDKDKFVRDDEPRVQSLNAAISVQ